MPRIFIAIPVGDEVRAALAALPHGDTPSLRWVSERQMHITLKFLGEIPHSKVDVVRHAVETAVERAFSKIGETAVVRPDSPFRLSAVGIGAFPNVDRARVIWAGVSKSSALLRVQTAIETLLGTHGFPLEERPFTPHITLARASVPTPLPGPLQKFRQHPFGSWNVDAAEVIESRLSSSGPRYRVLHRISLFGF